MLPITGKASDIPVLPLTISSDVTTATAGYFRLQWHAPSKPLSQFVLQESTHPSFTQPNVRYTGEDTARVVSGKADGSYYYRVGVAGTETWSEVIKVEVRHHSLQKALLFFMVGLIIFLATLFVIKRGSKAK